MSSDLEESILALQLSHLNIMKYTLTKIIGLFCQFIENFSYLVVSVTHLDFLSEELTCYSSLFLPMLLHTVSLKNILLWQGEESRLCVCVESKSRIVFIVLLCKDHSVLKI